MPDLYDLAALFRQELADRDAAALAEIARAYGAAYQAALAAPSQAVLLDHLAPALLQAGDAAAALLTDEQRTVVDLARAHAATMGVTLDAASPKVAISLALVPHAAMADLVGFAQDGTPLADLFREVGAGAMGRVRELLAATIATGLPPASLAAGLREALGLPLSRALTIARTETQRAYREASLRNYAANSDVLAGWYWHATNDARTCPVCRAMHGTFHPLTARLDGHPNCRCVMVPWPKEWRVMGLQPPASGVSLFAQLTEAEQRAVLGGRKYEAYRDGRITLPDLVKRTTDPRWGTMRTEATLEEAVANVRRRREREAAQRQNRREALARHERWVLERNPDHERAVLLDLAGRVVTRKEGGRGEVLWTVEALRPLYGKVDLITHNHPGRGSIGQDDFTLVLALNAREVNAVTPQLRFRLLRTGDAWPDTIVEVFRGEQARLADELGAALGAGRTTEAEVERVFYHELWQRVARRLPDRLLYEVERRT